MDDHQFDHDELLTARLSLRRPAPADIDAIYRIHHDPRACAHNPADMDGPGESGVAAQAKSAPVMPSAWPAGHWTNSIR